ncbi:hypothetical protein CcaverHIS002_0208340 [Cutaneotrichosporon cavernicola]|uniref:Uncharacterized protein n=1 Tax=Cutaneotrichosporon cavernicola TaxID=279322 RepID=A0AA48IFU0_9TREE|nr:uncharacterized protein CcaverHIS019_0208350 [Cutaneotrichosporon cavernicola]BEI81674.1 hypothetical protein CcaverHIS002_0208340 [Cutaneotrichosporon cavernicola]BEI89473.1 hypothetical protein CcaverHIS019_0208350 [Cutaneotrichosporon cavernicola]BEI97246.1 hypothetical protein CcaverHIS631_0208350 [Cutaneotrichosporon cavernicola]BEJ05020.1 hypothetical protein CcaverHIS641_0208370 [Cutaneotrichosporon cavernicola]
MALAPATTFRRRKSSSSQTLAQMDHSPALSPGFIIRRLVKHGKYVAAGAAGIWWLDLVTAVENLLESPDSWARRMLVAAGGLHALTLTIFLYLVVFLPWLRGYMPNYPKWQQSRRLRVIFPVLTTSILLGWSFLVFALNKTTHPAPRSSIHERIRGALDVQHRDGLGLFSSMAGATAIFSLTFGLLGLIPSPRMSPRVRKVN